MNLRPPYQYLAAVLRVVDGDTLEIVRDAGCGLEQRMTVRLYGVNAPETRGPAKAAGLLAAAYVRELLAQHLPRVMIRTHADKSGGDEADSFRRYLAEVVLEKADGTQTFLNEALIQAGHAVPYWP